MAILEMPNHHSNRKNAYTANQGCAFVGHVTLATLCSRVGTIRAPIVSTSGASTVLGTRKSFFRITFILIDFRLTPFLPLIQAQKD